MLLTRVGLWIASVDIDVLAEMERDLTMTRRREQWVRAALEAEKEEVRRMRSAVDGYRTDLRQL